MSYFDAKELSFSAPLSAQCGLAIEFCQAGAQPRRRILAIVRSANAKQDYGILGAVTGCLKYIDDFAVAVMTRMHAIPCDRSGAHFHEQGRFCVHGWLH